MNEKLLSIIVPVCNEESNLAKFFDELKNILRKNDLKAELIFVNDGSSDSSEKKLEKISSENSFVKVITLTKNFGQTAAMNAGIKEASGGLIVMMDADLQNDPADIPALIKKMKEGYDVVSGWRKNRKDAFLSRRLPSMIANALISKITGVKLKDYGCTLKIYKATFLKNTDLYGEMHRFLPAILGYMGARISEIAVNHRPRFSGKSKYGIKRAGKVLLDLLTVKFMGEYLGKPIYFFGGTAFFFLVFSGLFSVITLYNKFFRGIFVKDQPLFLLAILFAIIGVQFALLGLLAEILIRTYFKADSKHGYFIKSKKGF